MQSNPQHPWGKIFFDFDITFHIKPYKMDPFRENACPGQPLLNQTRSNCPGFCAIRLASACCACTSRHLPGNGQRAAYAASWCDTPGKRLPI